MVTRLPHEVDKMTITSIISRLLIAAEVTSILAQRRRA
jgi:hypothetical protein